jgi:hypothetical protein
MPSPTSLPTVDCPAPAVRANAQGIARIAVDDTLAQLAVTFLHPLTPAQQGYLTDPRSYSLTGGERLFPRVLTAHVFEPAGTPPDLHTRRVVLQLSEEGDFSIYTLTVSGADIDPFFGSHRLRFRLACDDPFDCREPPLGPPRPPELPVAIDYLAKDYASFRQALLDFLATRMPEWSERSEADIGVMLLELWAATADTLSYVQDRVASEAFLETATQRRSVAAHLALLGYILDEGAAARTFLQFQVNSVFTLPAGPGLRVSTDPRRTDQPVVVFESLTPTTLRPDHNILPVYTWGNADCCIDQSALSVAFTGVRDQLRPGDYLLFDAGPGRRDVVRLVAPPEILAADPVKVPGGPITLVRWSEATPLSRDYCVRSDALVVRANVVPATHGETFSEPLRALTADQEIALDNSIALRKSWERPPRQRLRLSKGPLAFLDPAAVALAAPVTGMVANTWDPIAAILAPAPRSVCTLRVDVDGTPWRYEQTLLDSGPNDEVFRVEIDDLGDATVTFGDGTFGRAPAETSDVTAIYRIGGGQAGNLGADALTLARPRALEDVSWLVRVTNPLPASGGRDLESRERARRFAPATIQSPLVAVTAADYNAAAEGFIDSSGLKPIQRASAAFRWTGSWLTVTLAVDPRGTEGLDPDLRAALLTFLETRRLAGYDLELVPAQYVPLEVRIEFCLRHGYRSGDVESGILRALSSSDVSGGSRGLFHPDNFSFGGAVYVSRLYAAIMAVPGVESAQITRLARLHAAHPSRETADNLRQGALRVGPNEIIRVDNDRNFPERGTLRVTQKVAT